MAIGISSDWLETSEPTTVIQNHVWVVLHMSSDSVYPLRGVYKDFHAAKTCAKEIISGLGMELKDFTMKGGMNKGELTYSWNKRGNYELIEVTRMDIL